MSTTFGVKIPSTGIIIPIAIARRIGTGLGKTYVYFTDPIAELLPHNIEVIAMDNTQQDINTIGDIIKHVEEQD